MTENLEIKIVKDKIYFTCKMEGETVTLPKPPEDYEYVLRKKPPLRDKDPSELTARQLATRTYREKNKEKLAKYNREYQKKKNSVNTSGQSQ